ncbi:SDR family oxidoreductase [Rhodococcus sp. AG1013]|uniref:SDR family oxidoreductase n=1 Tax=Rhodococcus sp. AG1013 TaxID=2183996 RepID=UPI000E0A15AC|nr:SDR family oxidoreductase [Rhodococcus sp. AG1013]
MQRPRVLVTGATGYIGGRLAPRLLAAGYDVRVLVRSPEKLRDVPWAKQVEIVRGDLGDPDSLTAATADMDVVYFLVHSMGTSTEFVETERIGASNLAAAAKASGVRRIVYLGGLHPEGTELSPHMRSRAQVGRILVDSGIPTMVLQAGVVIGSGSASFEMIRHLTNRLPVMTTPRWVNNRIQPIAVRDVLYYLVAAAEAPLPGSRTFDIGGPDVLTYGDMMKVYADVAGLRRRRVLVLPVLTPRLAGLWIGLVTPIPSSLGRALIESLHNDAVAANRDIDDVIPPPKEGLTPYRQAVRLALRRIRSGEVETNWASASPVGAPSDPLPSDPNWAGEAVYTDERSAGCDADADTLWRVLESIGGENGWYSFPLAWVIRGWLDRLVGGVGLTRGRRDARRLNTGDPLDFWRVEQIDRGSLLRLRAEMRTPGGAWLEWRVHPDGPHRSRLEQRAIFFPKGLAGRLYWYSILPFHGIIFKGMLTNITGAAAREYAATG